LLRRLVKFPSRLARRLARLVRPQSTPSPSAQPPRPSAPAPAPAPAAASPARPAARRAVPDVTVTVTETPNPNARRFTCSAPVMKGGATLSAATRADAEAHPLAKALMEFDYVSTVFLSGDFVTITKKPTANWDEMIQVLEGVVGEIVAQEAAGS
jgi:predicted lipid-binding transport protein (Tim44 family)